MHLRDFHRDLGVEVGNLNWRWEEVRKTTRFLGSILFIAHDFLTHTNSRGKDFFLSLLNFNLLSYINDI